MGFKALRSVNLPKRKQGLIYYTCRNFTDLPQEIQEKIVDLCAKCGGIYCHALFDVLTKGIPIRAAALKVPCGESTLERARKRFYEEWEKIDLTDDVKTLFECWRR